MPRTSLRRRNRCGPRRSWQSVRAADPAWPDCRAPAPPAFASGRRRRRRSPWRRAERAGGFLGRVPFSCSSAPHGRRIRCAWPKGSSRRNCARGGCGSAHRAPRSAHWPARLPRWRPRRSSALRRNRRHRRVNSSSCGLLASAIAVRSSSQEEITLPRRHTSAMSGRLRSKRSSSGSSSRVLALQNVEAFGIGLHQPVFDAVVHHLDEVPGAARPGMDIAASRRADRGPRASACAGCRQAPAPAPRRSDRAGRRPPFRRRSSCNSRARRPTPRPRCRQST